MTKADPKIHVRPLTYRDVEYAVAAQRIEGLEVSAETVHLMNKIVRGEIGWDEARAEILQRFANP